MVTPRYLPLLGGVEHHVARVAASMGADDDFEVVVLTTDPTGALAKREIIDGVEVRRVRAWPKSLDYYFAPGVIREVTRGPWDLVHVQSYHTLVAPLAMWAARRKGIPYVLTFHGGGHSSRLRGRLRGLQLRLLRPLVGRASRIVALAPFEIDRYSRQLEIPRGRFALVPNGADLPEVRDDPSRRADAPLIVSVGRLEQYKGHHRIVRAFPEILRRVPDARLWIAGEGPSRSTLEGLAARLHIADRVEIRSVDPRDRERWARELIRADLVVLLSDFETHPLAVLEAAWLGRPLLVAESPGLSNLIADGLAVGVAADASAATIASAAVGQLENPRYPQRAGLPTWRECALGLKSVYESVLAP